MTKQTKRVSTKVTVLPGMRPPSLREVRIYFSEKEMPEQEADDFYAAKTKDCWKGKKGKNMDQWKGEAFRWIAAVIKRRPWLFSRKVH